MKLTDIKIKLAAACLAGALLAGACGGPAGGQPTTVNTAATATIAAAATQAQATSASRPAVVFEWSAAIIQNGVVMPAVSDEVTLVKSPFILQLKLPQPVPVKLNAFNTDQNFQALQDGYVFTPDCELALCTGMDVAEEKLNPGQDLFVDPQLTHYLYYLAPDDNRWSRVTINDTGAVLERDVAKLNDMPIEQYADPALYLLLYADSANPDQIDPGELKKIVLKFQ